MSDLKERILNDFVSHEPTAAESDKMREVRARCQTLAAFIADAVPAGREQSTTLTKLEEVMFHANAGIARDRTRNS